MGGALTGLSHSSLSHPEFMTDANSRFNLHDAQLVVYDLDGTLIDAFADIWTCMNRALTDCGLPELPLERVKAGVGDGALNLARRCLGEAHARHVDRVYERYMHHYTADPAAEARVYPGVLETLDRVRALGLHQAVLTNKPSSVAAASCTRLGIAQRVDGIWGEMPGRPLKPDPESLRAVARHFAIPIERTAMVGDYQADHDVARAAGARMIGATWGLFSRERTAALAPDAMIDAMDELPALLRPEAKQ
jgi:phosphoglycolate phosphatase